MYNIMDKWFEEIFLKLNKFYLITEITNLYYSRSNIENKDAGPDKKYPVIRVQYKYELDVENWRIYFRWAEVRHNGQDFELITVKETPITVKRIETERTIVDIFEKMDYTKLTAKGVFEMCKTRNIPFSLSDINDWENNFA